MMKVRLKDFSDNKLRGTDQDFTEPRQKVQFFQRFDMSYRPYSRNCRRPCNSSSISRKQMLAYNFPTLLRRYGIVLWRIFVPHKKLTLPRYTFRLLTLVLVTFVFLLLQLINFICLILDEILYRDYRYINIHRPIFIVGAPRSGTTYTHRNIAKIEGLTTTALWECLFAPSIVQRKVIKGISRLDAVFGSPLYRLLIWLEKTVLPAFSNEHDFSLRAPEEDFVFMLPLLHCFLLLIPFPGCQWIWRFAKADKNNNDRWTRICLRWYRHCIQKHLYCHPESARYLSKNPSFSGLAQHLTTEFPDCQLIICERDAPTAVESLFRVLKPLRLNLAGAEHDHDFDRKLRSTLKFYYTNLDIVRESLPSDRCKAVELWCLSKKPDETFIQLREWIMGESVSSRFDQASGTFQNAATPAVDHLPKTTAPVSKNAIDTDRLTEFHQWRCPEERRL